MLHAEPALLERVCAGHGERVKCVVASTGHSKYHPHDWQVSLLVAFITDPYVPRGQGVHSSAV